LLRDARGRETEAAREKVEAAMEGAAAATAMTGDNAALLLEERAEGVLRLIMNRPAQRNALSVALMRALSEALERAAADKDCRAVIIAGAGPAFCAGHDLRELRSFDGEGRRAAYERIFAQCSALMLQIVRLPKPVIAEVHGVATAAGCQLVATCDLAVAAAEARFATPGVNIGLFCSTPMVALSRAVGRKPAMEMLLTGELIDAASARALGLVNRVVPAAELTAATAALAGQIAAKSALTLKIGKEAFYRQAELGLADAYKYASEIMTVNMLAQDAAEGIDAFLEKRPPVWRDA
jgi:enoyl-CoA hydratase/carnithine racemase